jgi:hypothetical protein
VYDNKRQRSTRWVIMAIERFLLPLHRRRQTRRWRRRTETASKKRVDDKTFYEKLIDFFLCASSPLELAAVKMLSRQQLEARFSSLPNIHTASIPVNVLKPPRAIYLEFPSPHHSPIVHGFTYLVWLSSSSFSLLRFYLWRYVTVSPRLLFVMFSECFIINDPERASEQWE